MTTRPYRLVISAAGSDPRRVIGTYASQEAATTAKRRLCIVRPDLAYRAAVSERGGWVRPHPNDAQGWDDLRMAAGCPGR